MGGLAAGIAGTLTNDSGPVLLVNAVIALAGVTAYILGGTQAKAAELEDAGRGRGRERPGPAGRGPRPHELMRARARSAPSSS